MTCANHPDRERTAFCQHCGKPLCQECTRSAGNAVFCEPCLAARVSGQPATGYPYNPNFPPPPAPGEPSPALAGLLGLIPGVGAMYNGQYAKGFAHLAIFFVFASFEHISELFGILLMGWVIYQAFDAYHTARARRDGTPLPNPFGLNDIGERFGFQNPPEPPPAASAPQPPPPNPTPNQGSASNMPPYNYRYDYNYSYQYPPVPPANPGDAGNPFEDIKPHHGFPTAAIWLIALGVLFLLGNLSILPHFYARQFVPFLFIGLGVWIFLRTSHSLGHDPNLDPRVRIFHASKGAIWLVCFGIFFLLTNIGLLSWGHGWPLFLILAGLMLLVRRAIYSGISPYGVLPQQPAPPADPGTAIVTTTHNKDEEI